MYNRRWGNLISDMAGVFLGGTVAQVASTPYLRVKERERERA
jgi:hypothetical protein